MDGFLLQDWTTIGGADAGYTIIQSESSWLDLEAYDDVVFFTMVRQVTGTATLTFQTAPAPEDAAFVQLVPAFAMVALSSSSPPRVDRALASVSLVPVARYVRWMLTGGAGTFNATFRVWVAAYGPNS